MLTTLEAVGKHETWCGVQHRFLCITGPDVKYDTDRTFTNDYDERL